MMKTKNMFPIIYITIIVILASFIPLSYEWIHADGRRYGAIVSEYYLFAHKELVLGEDMLSALTYIDAGLNGDRRDETIKKLNNLIKDFPKSTYIDAVVYTTDEYFNQNNKKELKDIIKYWEGVKVKLIKSRCKEMEELFSLNRELVYIIPIIVLLFSVPIAFMAGLNIGRFRSVQTTITE